MRTSLTSSHLEGKVIIPVVFLSANAGKKGKETDSLS
jgi:hypothetical protein